MHTFICIIIGMLVGGTAGTAAMCLVQVSRCAECTKRENGVSKGAK